MQKIRGKYPQIKGNLAKNDENQFFIFRPPFFAEKQKIEKKRKTKFFRFGATHTLDGSYLYESGEKRCLEFFPKICLTGPTIRHI